MSDERRSTQERLLAAFASSDLSVDVERRGDADHLIALGLAEQRVPLAGGDVLRLQLAGNPADYRRARESVLGLTRRLSAVRRWNFSAANLKRIAELALAHHVWPACPVCHGRGYEAAEGAPLLSGRLCRACHGTGARPIQRKFNNEIRGVIEVLERIGSVTEHAVQRLLR